MRLVYFLSDLTPIGTLCTCLNDNLDTRRGRFHLLLISCIRALALFIHLDLRDSDMTAQALGKRLVNMSLILPYLVFIRPSYVDHDKYSELKLKHLHGLMLNSLNIK